jgi:hypothetical protein
MKLPIWAYAATAVIVLGGLGGAVAYIRHEGYRDGEAAATARCAEEQARAARANQNAIDAANKRLIERADELMQKELQLDDYVKAIDLATAQDPRAGDQCLDADSVRRLNSIR